MTRIRIQKEGVFIHRGSTFIEVGAFLWPKGPVPISAHYTIDTPSRILGYATSFRRFIDEITAEVSFDVPFGCDPSFSAQIHHASGEPFGDDPYIIKSATIREIVYVPSEPAFRLSI